MLKVVRCFDAIQVAESVVHPSRDTSHRLNTGVSDSWGKLGCSSHQHGMYYSVGNSMQH